MVKTNNDLAESEATLDDFRDTEKSTPSLSVQAPGASVLAIANDISQLASIVGEDGEERQLQAETAQSPEVAPRADLSHSRMMRTVMVILTLTAITATSSMSTGLVTIGIPHIAQDLQLPESLILWPGSVYALANGCCLLLAGSVADMIGNRNINLTGSLMLAVFIAVSGGAQTGVQFILFRALQGVGASMFFPTSISILATAVPSGRSRNVGFGCLGFAQPVGLQVGLLLSGVFENAPVTWRFGFYLCAGVTMVFFAIACWCLPKDRPRETLTWARLIYRIDWLGIFISSTSFGLLSYVLAYVLLSRTHFCLTELIKKSEVTGSVSKIHDAANITLLSISAVLAPLFIFWMHRQETRGNVALIPNSLWKNKRFSTICFMVVICWAVANSMDWFFSLFFQLVQHLSPIEAALRFLPNVIFGIVVNVATGLLVHRLPTNIFVVSVSVISTLSPLLMAVINSAWSFWLCVFWAMLNAATAQDVIYTVANLIIIDAFPADMHALAGAVFSTISMIGTAVGIAVLAVVSESVTTGSAYSDKSSPEALMLGYRVAFWICFGLMVLMTLTGAVGLRKVWKVGMNNT